MGLNGVNADRCEYTAWVQQVTPAHCYESFSQQQLSSKTFLTVIILRNSRLTSLESSLHNYFRLSPNDFRVCFNI